MCRVWIKCRHWFPGLRTAEILCFSAEPERLLKAEFPISVLRPDYISLSKIPHIRLRSCSAAVFYVLAGHFFDFYRSKMLHPEAVPNGAHLLLAELEGQGKLKAVITQNIDGLHQKAGSRAVFELHGSVHRNHCMGCGCFYPLETVTGSAERVPRCGDCGGIIKPDVVLYEEELDHDVLVGSVAAIAAADLLIIGGTSLTVQPAASLVTYFHGRHTVLLNGEPTPYDHRADLIITDRIGEVMGRVLVQL